MSSCHGAHVPIRFTSALLVAAALCRALPAQQAQPAPQRITSAKSSSKTAFVQVRGPIYGDDLVRTAKKYLGVRYELGGSTPRAFDCSGFVKYVFAQHGIDMPRTAHEQSTVGDAPYPGDVQSGDLLFFWGGRGAQHIAIYVGGDTIIHASSRSGRVKLDHFSGSPHEATWFGERLIAVRRVLPAEGVLNIPMTATSAPHAP